MTSTYRLFTLSALGALLVLSLSLAGATPADASVTVNFDALDTSGGPVSQYAIDTYLGGFGITQANATPTTFLRVMTPLLGKGDTNVVLVTNPNYMAQWWSGVNGTSFDLIFNQPLESLYVSIPQITSGVSVPAWSFTALNANATPLTTSYGQAGLSGASARRTFEFLDDTDPGLQGLRVYSNVLTHAGMGGIPIDDLEFTQQAAAVPEPSSFLIFAGLTLFFGAAGWWRRQRRHAA